VCRNYLSHKQEKQERRRRRREKREASLEQQRARAVHLGYMDKGALNSRGFPDDEEEYSDEEDGKSVDETFNIVSRGGQIAL
jgi:hypothetical protein